MSSPQARSMRVPEPTADNAAPKALLLLAAALATTAPTLLAYNVAPSSTFLNQALSFALWGWFVMACAAWLPRSPLPWRAAAPLFLALLLLTGAASASSLWRALPVSLGISALGTLIAALLLAVAAVASARSVMALPLFAAFCWGWVVAGVLGAAIGTVQVFFPALPDGDWIAHSSIVGRAVGNLRQPNHLSSVLLWACVALVALVELRRLTFKAAAVLFALMVFAVVLTASRTGLLSVLLLALWGLADRRMHRATRMLLLVAPVIYLLAWLVMSAWGQAGQHAFGGAARLAETDISGSRFGIWANALTLIAQQPWLGVGFGEFNFAWSLTPFPGRPTAFFDHAHNLPLHLAAELGLPLAGAVMLMLLWALWRVLISAWRSDGDSGTTQRCAFMMVLMIGLHSLLEYPLWYAYFLLPAVWVWGHALGHTSADGATQSPAPTALSGSAAFTVAGALLVFGAALSVVDYTRVTVIFSAPEGAAPLEQRIAAGQRSVFFAHHADYAAATVENADKPLAPFRSAAHYLLDTRLMTAWAEAMKANGHDEAARHLAARLREFRNPLSKDYFAVCEVASRPAPFQCVPPQRPLNWRELVK